MLRGSQWLCFLNKVNSTLQNRRYFLHFSGERGQARGEHEVRDAQQEGREKIIPVHQPLFMLFRPQTHPQITNQLQRLIEVARNGLSCFASHIQSHHR